jgi:hypothetical protein
MKKTKRKMVKRKKVNKRRTVKSKGGKQSKTVTVYAWPKENPDTSKKPNKMMYMIDVTNNNGYKSKIYESVEDADEWAEYMTNGNTVVPADVNVQTKSLVVGKN